MPPRRKQPSDANAEEVEISEGVFPGRAHWERTTELPVLFANHMFIQLVEGDFLLTFGRAEIPYISGEEQMRKAVATQGIGITAVARLAVPGQKMGSMIEVLNRIYEKWVTGQVQLNQETGKEDS